MPVCFLLSFLPSFLQPCWELQGDGRVQEALLLPPQSEPISCAYKAKTQMCLIQGRVVLSTKQAAQVTCCWIQEEKHLTVGMVQRRLHGGYGI